MQYLLFDDDKAPDPRPVRNDVMLGDAAEAFTIAKLLKWGFDAHDARRDAPYDVGVDLRDGRICRVQVKGQGQARQGKWDFRLVRGNPRTGTGSYAYSDNDYDVTAVVALSIEKVLFYPGVHHAIRLSTPDFLRPDAEAQSWEQALQVFKSKPFLNQ
jgi:hypothetical protein